MRRIGLPSPALLLTAFLLATVIFYPAQDIHSPASINSASCDSWSIYADANGDCSKDEFPDLLHPNAIGYAKWSAALNRLFAKLNLEKEKTQ